MTDTRTLSYSRPRLHYYSGIECCSDILLFEASAPLFFQEWTDTRTFSYPVSRIHHFSGMDRYSDFFLFGASSSLLFRDEQIPGLSPIRDLVSIIIQEGQLLGLSPIRGLVSIIIQEWTDTRTFSYLRPRLHYHLGIGSYSDYLLFEASSPL